MRNKWIDDVRGLTIVLMIIGHIIGGLIQFDGENNLFRTMIYQFHMPLLFTISGFLSKPYEIKEGRIKDYCIFTKDLIYSLYFPYLLWGTFFWSVKFFLFQGNEPVTVSDLLCLPWSLNAWYPGWFLLALMGIRLIDRGFEELQISILFQSIFWILILVLSYTHKPLRIILNIMEFGCFYLWGKLLKRSNYLITSRVRYIAMLIIFVGIGIFMTGEYQLSKPVLSMGVSWLVFYTAPCIKYDSKIIRSLGMYSMIPYVLHAYFIIPFKIILMRLQCDRMLIYVIVETCSAVFFSMVVIKIAEKWPIVMSMFYPRRLKRVYGRQNK